MPNKDRNIPKRRFKAFENADAWELRKLGEVVSELKSGLSRELSSTDIGLPVVRANNISDNQLNLEKDIKYWYQNDPQGSDTSVYFIEQNDILVNFINSEAKMGTAAIVKNSPSRPTIYTTNILRMRCTNDLIPYFFLYYTNLDCYKNFIKGITKIAVNQASFTTVDYKKYELFVPEVDEQSTIGTFFSTLDQHITLHQRKLDKLKSVKQAYLSEMFPAEGERVPKRRFPGFTDDWELRKLGEVMDFSVKTNSLSRDRLSADIYDVQNVHYGDILTKFNDVLDISKTALPSIVDSNVLDFKDALLSEGDIVFADAAEDETVGKAVEIRNLNGKNVVSGLHTIVARPKNSFAPFYMGYFINSQVYHNQILPLMQGTKVSSISKSNLQSTCMSYPSYDEQSAIGTFFSTLDRHITLHQRKLEKLKNLKKALLNELFV
ncbi:TPA: restriction endonuclease subunit S [Streptococcus suis]